MQIKIKNKEECDGVESSRNDIESTIGSKAPFADLRFNLARRELMGGRKILRRKTGPPGRNLCIDLLTREVRHVRHTACAILAAVVAGRCWMDCGCDGEMSVCTCWCDDALAQAGLTFRRHFWGGFRLHFDVFFFFFGLVLASRRVLAEFGAGCNGLKWVVHGVVSVFKHFLSSQRHVPCVFFSVLEGRQQAGGAQSCKSWQPVHVLFGHYERGRGYKMLQYTRNTEFEHVAQIKVVIEFPVCPFQILLTLYSRRDKPLGPLRQ